ncbi:hypothetical protein JTE90_017407 [Oedothorax gibbosus]|uniref:Uncharacterized protein n=1 Tax=Oedothorax gibbosus TaxID=931172 RepID=A0AAV6U7E5_9ARAC|nr:hypothetical protein JTE90_017407 [Oedothorax gibbosus]
MPPSDPSWEQQVSQFRRREEGGEERMRRWPPSASGLPRCKTATPPSPRSFCRTTLSKPILVFHLQS